MSNCEQQLQMTNRHCAGEIDAAEQEDIEVLSSVMPGSRMSCAREALVVNKPDMQGVISATQAGDSPLPCRGCTRNCSRYGRCNHTPWRSADMSRKRASQQTDSTDCINLIKTCSVA